MFGLDFEFWTPSLTVYCILYDNNSTIQQLKKIIQKMNSMALIAGRANRFKHDKIFNGDHNTDDPRCFSCSRSLTLTEK